jgi:hypothetical protein
MHEKNGIKTTFMIDLTVRRQPAGKVLTIIACISYQTEQVKSVREPERASQEGKPLTSSMIGPLAWKSSG